MSSAAQELWDRLPLVERDRRIAYYDRIARRAYSHCCTILIGCPYEPTTETRNGTGIHVRVEGHSYIITAKHVLDEFAGKLELAPAHFQIGELVLNPWSRLVYEDKQADLAVMAIDSNKAAAVGGLPDEPAGPWPPPPPKDGDFVHLFGFAAANIKNGSNGTIDSFSLHLFGEVMTPHHGHFFARIDRTGIPTENVGLLPPPGTPSEA